MEESLCPLDYSSPDLDLAHWPAQNNRLDHRHHELPDLKKLAERGDEVVELEVPPGQEVQESW
jgi:hypothetical protein